jgi:hypothetical protein
MSRGGLYTLLPCQLMRCVCASIRVPRRFEQADVVVTGEYDAGHVTEAPLSVLSRIGLHGATMTYTVKLSELWRSPIASCQATRSFVGCEHSAEDI